MNRNLTLGITIIIIGLIVAGGIFVSRKKPEAVFIQEEITSREIIEVNPISNSDYILGSPNAKIIIIEYTHLECTYSQHFHETMMKIIKKYGPRGEVAWIIRHFPVPELFPNSYEAAVAVECVTNINKEDKGIFWQYMQNIFETTPTEITPQKLKDTAIAVGTDEKLYDFCVLNKQYTKKIETDTLDANKLVKIDNNFMTPYNLIATRTGLQTMISGSVDYVDLKNMIDQMLINMD